MRLPSHQEIRTQLALVVGFATMVLAATTVIFDKHSPEMRASKSALVPHEPSIRDESAKEVANAVSVKWDDVNFHQITTRGEAVSPEKEVNTARSEVLRGMEAR